jgi:hypothetical protein
MFSPSLVAVLTERSLNSCPHKLSRCWLGRYRSGVSLALQRDMLSPEQLVAWGFLVLLSPATLAPAGPLSPVSATACDPPARTLPISIQIDSSLEPLVRQALAYSPRFREQCRVLAATANLRATISIGTRYPGIATRARAVVRRSASGVVFADIVIKDPSEAIELLAHELEHVIEQLDGVNLTSAAKKGQAHRLGDGAFETARAISAGQQVAGEVLDNAPDRILGAGARLWGVLRRSIMRR